MGNKKAGFSCFFINHDIEISTVVLLKTDPDNSPPATRNNTMVNNYRFWCDRTKSDKKINGNTATPPWNKKRPDCSGRFFEGYFRLPPFFAAFFFGAAFFFFAGILFFILNFDVAGLPTAPTNFQRVGEVTFPKIYLISMIPNWFFDFSKNCG
jgi:hypothetical protein